VHLIKKQTLREKRGDHMGNVGDDGKRRWRKYGEKRVKVADCDGTCRRSYYRCSAFSGCKARKYEDVDASNAVSIVFQGEHVHCEVVDAAPEPVPQARSGGLGDTVHLMAEIEATTSKPPLSKPKTVAGGKRRFRLLNEINCDVVNVPAPERLDMTPKLLSASPVLPISPTSMQDVGMGMGGGLSRPDGPKYFSLAWTTQPSLHQAAAANVPTLTSLPTPAMASTAANWAASWSQAQHSGTICIRDIAGENAAPLLQPVAVADVFGLGAGVGTHSVMPSLSGGGRPMPLVKVDMPTFFPVPSPTSMTSSTMLMPSPKLAVHTCA